MHRAHANSRFFPSSGRRRGSERGKNNHTNKAVTANKRSESGRASERGFAGRRQPRKGGRKAAIRWISEEGGFSLPSLGRTESAAKRIGKTTKSVFSASAISTRSEERRRRRPLPLITTRRLRHFSRVFAPFLPEKLPTRAESRNLIPGEEGRRRRRKLVHSSSSSSLPVVSRQFLPIYTAVVECRVPNASTAKAAYRLRLLFMSPPLFVISARSLRRTIEFEELRSLRSDSVIKRDFMEQARRSRASERVAITAGRKFQLTHTPLLPPSSSHSHMAVATAIALIARQSSRW